MHFPDLLPGKHLVLDNVNVADTYRLRRRVHQPQKEPGSPVLIPECPSDGQSVTPLHVVFDPDRNTWRMWYQAHDEKIAAARKQLGRTKNGNVGEPQPIYCSYAESADGIRWDKPNLGIYGDTNVAFKGFSEVAGNTFIHRPDAAPDQRWLMVNNEWYSETTGGLYIAYSPDGLHWKYPDTKPIIHGDSDTWNCIVWNPERKVYMLYLRAWHAAAVNWPDVKKRNRRRRVGYAESTDLKNWSEWQIILAPDELDTEDFYGFQVFRYADYYLGQLWIYNDEADETIEIELAWSRDGILWERHPERPKFIPRGKAGAPDGYMISPAQEPVIHDGRLVHYYAGRGLPHYVHNNGAVGYRSTLRLDGFVSLDAGPHHGALITRPFTVVNDDIRINAAVYGGELVAELVEPYYHEPEGKPIEGFAAKDFDVIRGDSTAHQLSWGGNSDLRALRGRRVMLRMQLHRAEFYSFTI